MKKYILFFSALFYITLVCITTSVYAQTEITNWTQLNEIRNNLGGSFILVNDLNENTAGYASFNTGEGWMPVGAVGGPFTGTFDGGGYTISGLRIQREMADLGFFGHTTNATIQNVTFADVDVTAVLSSAGVVVGHTIAGTIKNVHVSGTFKQIGNPDATNFGGIIGRMRGGLVTESSSAVNIQTVGRFVGGIAGTMTGFNSEGATVQLSSNTGNITSAFRWIGGITGQFGGASTIRNSYNTGDITGTTQVGGLTGFHWRASELHNSYSVGKVVGDEEFGALVGHMDPPQGAAVGKVEFSFFDTETSGLTVGLGIGEANGAFGRTTAQMKEQGTYNGWDFTSVWAIKSDFNDGYPVLQFQVVTSVDGFDQMPSALQLAQNYPNPFNPSTTIRFELPESEHVNLSVYTLTGQQIAQLVNETRSAGVHEVRFDAGNLASGIYVYRITAGSAVQTRRMTLVK
jgi:hypothetical protein